ncbi:MAG TPA: non-homologous end-joining DNA ligase [Bryobacteraceae bacterium]|nr:non-homologous end-joining DNA ligase [Bryobacteraceae bacterium]
MKVAQHVEIEGRSLVLSNLDKVLYPASGFTKAQVIDYYIRIAPWLLPHFAKRPVTMKRFPDGAPGKAFYEKDAPKHTPAWIQTTEVPRQAGGKPIRYICIDDLATLVWCANMASLELHPFLHRAGQLDQPDAIVFDLDPGEGTSLVTCAEVGFSLKALLEAKELECFAKVSGSKGLQVYVPLNPKVTYERTRSFAQSAAIALQRQKPELVISDMAKTLRQGKIFIDWSQNSDFKTTIGVYSLRATRDEPFVSMPVTWDELAKLRRSGDASKLRFTPYAALKRVAAKGDLFAPLLTLKQSLPDTLRMEERVEHAVKPAKQTRRSKPMARTRSKPDEDLEVLPKARAEFIPPMLLLRTEQLPEGASWLYELKLDGYRAIAAKARGKVSLWSRNENDFEKRYPTIAAALAALPDDTVIDGEIVALDGAGKPSFNALQKYGLAHTPLLYYVFDVPVLKGRDLRGAILEQRRARLETDVFPFLHEPIRPSPVLPGSLADLITAVKEQGLEGLVAKQRGSRYEPGERSGAWQKMRVNEGQEFVIGGYTVGGPTFDALVFGYYEGSRLMYVARTRNGFTPSARAQLMQKFRGLEIPDCPFANLPEKRPGRWGQGLTAAKMKDCRWLKPVLVGQFEFREWTLDDHLRHSRFVGLRDDKMATSVRREQARRE